MLFACVCICMYVCVCVHEYECLCIHWPGNKSYLYITGHYRVCVRKRHWSYDSWTGDKLSTSQFFGYGFEYHAPRYRTPCSGNYIYTQKVLAMCREIIYRGHIDSPGVIRSYFYRCCLHIVLKLPSCINWQGIITQAGTGLFLCMYLIHSVTVL